jgi:hypothetical protein
MGYEFMPPITIATHIYHALAPKSMADLTKEQYARLKEALDSCIRPLFFFDDDPDGTAAYLTLFRYKKEGVGVAVKTSPCLNVQFVGKVLEHMPDAIFVLDLPQIEQEFIDRAKVPVYMLDHHAPLKMERLHYFNPRLNGNDEPVCTSHMCAGLVDESVPAWVPLIGIVGDWMYTERVKDFAAKNPDLIPPHCVTAPQVLFDSTFGEVVTVVSFALKGKTKESYDALKHLHKIKDPREILTQSTPEGKALYKKAQPIKAVYDDLFSQAVARANDSPILEFIYTDAYMSVTKDLSNRIYHRYPDKVIIVGREHNGEVKLSMRALHHHLPTILDQALIGIHGYGGGHDHACGACVKTDDYTTFITSLSSQITK